MTKTLCIINMKGGVGKTTTSINLAIALGKKGKKVLLCDLDPQANLTDYLIQEEQSYIYIDEILEGKKIQVYETHYNNLFLIPSRLDLATTEKKILLSSKAQHNRLYKAIKPVLKDFDYVIIDCPPILNLLTVNALNVSDEVIIPIKIDKAAQKGFKITLRNIHEIAESYDLDIEYKVLFTMVTRTKIDKQKINEISIDCGNQNVIKTTIRNQAKPVKEASYNQSSVIEGKSGVGNDYLDLVDELLEMWR